MTTAATTATTAAAGAAATGRTGRKALPAGRYDLAGLLRSEWTKLRTVRSTVWTLGITVVVGIGISALATGEARAHWSTMALPARLAFDPTRISLIPLFFCQLAIGVLGVLAMSAEFGTGTARATFAAAPRRLHVLAAKVGVFGLVSLVVAEATAFLSFLVGQAMLTAPARHASLATPGALRAVAGTGLYLCVVGLFGLGLATVIRHTAGAISAYVGVLLVLPLVVQALPSSLQTSISRFLPSKIGVVMMTPGAPGTPHTFSAWPGFLLLCAYALVVLAAGGLLLVRRDV